MSRVQARKIKAHSMTEFQLFFCYQLTYILQKIDYSFTKNTTVFSSYFLVFTGEYGMEEN